MEDHSTIITVPLMDDFHVHLRQGALMKAVTSLLPSSGVGTALVMPNLKPPITSTDHALEYKAQLQAIAPTVDFLMTLYLGPDLTPDEIRKAARAGVVGVKSYPRGVTTNSEAGIESYAAYYPVFAAMAEEGMVLNLHGEVPSDDASDTCVLNAEERFLTHLEQLHRDFPTLRIVLEHATTKAAVDMVKALGPTVACTVTLHHLVLTADSWAGQCHHFCKPVAKYPRDRSALQDVVRQGHERFFLGTDSAPHARHLKESGVAVAGVYTGAHVAVYCASILESFGALHRLQSFACENGRRFYGLPPRPKNAATITLKRGLASLTVQNELPFVDDDGQARAIVPFLAGKELNWSIKTTGNVEALSRDAGIGRGLYV
ncbi:dihydroorotase [Synchytrium endobioticum]|uniref:dihydroorotase n=1 Tax=Synchytrium endobioticum TaxID=286115 RepID=A0A507DET2_9FUNG|nr:dihydroorotase [Synchytrium endobioticum]TPX50209.1 dihydroorotase [Synchytrium endobioticum]